MTRKKKSDDKKEFKYFGFNLKVRSNKRHGTELYTEVIKDLFSKDVIAQIGGEKAITLRTQFSTDIPYKGNTGQIFYGKITRYTTLDGKNWYDKTKKDFVNFSIPLNIFPNGFETDYVFVPNAHRFFIRVSPKVGITPVLKFLEMAVPQVILADESCTINIIQSQDVIDKIIESAELQLLKVELSYTNDDIGDEAQKLMDELLKEGKIGEISAVLKPDNTGKLDTNSSFVRGVLELAKENGEAEATIKDENGRKQRIITHSYPEKILVRSEDEDTAKVDLFINTMKTYRDE